MENDPISRITADLAATGWSVCPDFLPAEQARALARESRELWQEGDFRRAAIGRGSGLQVRDEVRGDHVRWLEESTLTPAQRCYWDQLDRLRCALNQELFLGLCDFEGHLAVYPPGAFYRRHLDQHQKTGRRVVSVILYLNESWQESDGGQLRLYLDDSGEQWRDVVPIAGTLACFLSAGFYHEVLPATRERISLTGWFRRRD